MKVRIWFNDDNEKYGREHDTGWDGFDSEDAEEAAEWAWDNNGGWEWMRDGATVHVRALEDLPDGSVKSGDVRHYRIEVEIVPQFNATRVKEG